MDLDAALSLKIEGINDPNTSHRSSNILARMEDDGGVKHAKVSAGLRWTNKEFIKALQCVWISRLGVASDKFKTRQIVSAQKGRLWAREIRKEWEKSTPALSFFSQHMMMV